MIGDDPDEVGADGPILCGCHASSFSRTGETLSGPAPRRLPHYQLALADGRLVADTFMEVASDTRVANL